MIVFSILFPAIACMTWFSIRRLWILVYKHDHSPQKIDFKPLSPTNMSLGESQRNFLLTFLITLLVLFFSALSGAIGSAIYQPPKYSNQTSAVCTAETNPPVTPPFINASETFTCREVGPEIFDSFPDSLSWLYDKTISSLGGLALILLVVLVVEIIGFTIYWHSNRKNEYLLDELYGSFQTGEKDPKLFGPEYREGLKKNLETIFKTHPTYKEMSSVNRRLRRIDSHWPDRSRFLLIALYATFFMCAYTRSEIFENAPVQIISGLIYMGYCIFFIRLDPYASRIIQNKKRDYLTYSYEQLKHRYEYVKKSID